MGMWATLHTKKRASGKLRAAGTDHGSSIRDILAMRNMVALRLIFEFSKDLGLHI
jgi:hypothetical protein